MAITRYMFDVDRVKLFDAISKESINQIHDYGPVGNLVIGVLLAGGPNSFRDLVQLSFYGIEVAVGKGPEEA